MNSAQSCHVANKCTIAKKYLLLGIIGGLAGGLVFGIMMWQMGMLSMIGSMVGVNSAWAGAAIHLMMSMIFGAVAGLLLKFIPSCPGKITLFAVAYGVLLWVIGPLLVMPLMMGGGLFVINNGTMMSLMGHVIYALITVFSAHLMSKRAVKCC